MVPMSGSDCFDPFIYGLVDPSEDDLLYGLRYVGQTRVGMRRPRAHFRVDEALRNDDNKHKANWIRKLKRQGLKPDVVVLESIEWGGDLDELVYRLNDAERRIIREWKAAGANLLNIQEGGTSGYVLSEKEKEKISASRSWVSKKITVENIDLSRVFGPWSREKAWWLGLTFSHVRVTSEPGKRVVSFTTRFVDLADKWKVFAGAELRPTRWRGGCWVVDHGDVRLVKWLIEEYGLDKKWENRLEYPDGMPDMYAIDFVRGLWDSKAYMKFTERENRQPSILTSVESSAWSKDFTEQITLRVPGVSLHKGAVGRDGERAFGIAARGASTAPFLEILYRDAPSETSCLVQKHKALGIVEQWNSLLRDCRFCDDRALVGRDLCAYHSRVKWDDKECECGNTPVIAKGLCRACYQRQYSNKKNSWIDSSSTLRWLKDYDIKLWQQSDEDEKEKKVNEIVRIYRKKRFPWFELDDADPSGVVDSVIRGKLTVDEDTIRNVSHVGQRICRKAHPYRFRTSYRGKRSVVDAFDNDKCLIRAVRYQLKCGDPITPKRVIASLLALNKSPTNFPPSLARWLADTYAPQNGVVFDPCAGFGGRLLGVVSSRKRLRYIGVDIQPEIVTGNKRLAELVEVSDRVEVEIGDALTVDWPVADLVIAGPPYFDRESYGAQADASTSRFLSIDQWMRGFFGVLVEKAMASAPVAVFNIGTITSSKDRVELPSMATSLIEDLGFQVEKSWKWILPSFGHSSRDERLLVIRRK